MRNGLPLFFQEDLSDQLRARQDRVSGAVDAIHEQQFLISSDLEIVDYTVSQLFVEPLALREDAITMKQTETQVDVSSDSMRYFSPGRRGPFYIAGTRVDVDIPFVGEDWLFRCRTSTWSSVFPNADVNKDRLLISISLPHDADREEFKNLYEREVGLIKQYIGWSHSQVIAYNESLSQLAMQAIASRRERLKKHADIAGLLDIPLTARKGAPSITPMKVEIREPPPLPVPPKTGVKPEPGITDETYEHILQFIRHQGRTFETAPATFSMHDEEGLRDIILAQLNGHFSPTSATRHAIRLI